MFMKAPVPSEGVGVGPDGAGLVVVGVTGAEIPPGDPLTVAAPSCPDWVPPQAAARRRTSRAAAARVTSRAAAADRLAAKVTA
jgi:hypothetical protein